MHNLRLKVWVCGFFLTGLLAGGAAGELPGAGDPDTYTEHDYRREALDFYRRTLPEAYRQTGKRDPSWDALAEELLEGWALRWAYNDASTTYRRPGGIPSADELAALAEQALAVGCDDPLVLYAAGRFREATGGWDEAQELSIQAGEAMRGSGYAPLHRRNALVAARNRLDDDDPRHADFNTQLDGLVVAMITWDGYKPFDRRLIYHDLWGELEERGTATREMLMQRIEQAENADPWLAAMFRGEHETEFAWEIRGNSYANKVAEDAWAGFYERLHAAKAALKRAHALEPAFPEASAAMIPVVMGLPGDHDAEQRQWFERAVAGQLDYHRAYTNYSWALRPRWGGSHQAMYDLGREALDTGRFDTRVPWIFVDNLRDICDERDSHALWADAQVWADAERFFAGVLAEPRRERDRGYWRSMYAAAAYAGERYALARSQLDRITGDPSELAWRRLNINQADRAISETHVRGGAHATTLAFAERRAEQGSSDEAIAMFETLLADLPGDDRGRLYVRSVLLDTQLRADAANGRGTALIDGDWAAMWDPVAGEWQRDADGALVGRSAQRNYRQGLILKSRTPFPARGRLTGRIEVEGDALPNAAVLLNVRRNSGWDHFYSVIFWPTQGGWPGGVDIERYFEPRRDVTAETPLARAFDFDLTWWDGQACLLVDGQVVIERAAWPDDEGWGKRRIALGARAGVEGHTVRFSGLMFYAADAEPPVWAMGP